MAGRDHSSCTALSVGTQHAVPQNVRPVVKHQALPFELNCAGAARPGGSLACNQDEGCLMSGQASRLCRFLLWEDSADQAVAQEDLGGLLRGPGPDGGIIVVPGGVHVAPSVDDLPEDSEHMPPRLLLCYP